jgi:predicted HAD superfamily hydrolase
MNKRIKRKRNKRMGLLAYEHLSLKETYYYFNRENVRCEYEYLSRLSNEPKYNKTNLRRALRYTLERFGYVR